MENIYTSALRRAAKSEGTTQALAGALRVPEATLLLWMSGRAMMPLAAFRKLLDILVALEQREPPPAAQAHRYSLTFTVRELTARCGQCGHAVFLAPSPADALPYTALLPCASCGAEARHRDLIAQLVQDTRMVARPTRPAGRTPGSAKVTGSVRSRTQE